MMTIIGFALRLMTLLVMEYIGNSASIDLIPIKRQKKGKSKKKDRKDNKENESKRKIAE